MNSVPTMWPAFLLVIFCGVAGVVLALTMRETCAKQAVRLNDD